RPLASDARRHAMADTTFTRMQDATREDYKLIGRHSLEFFVGLPDRILRHLELLDSDTGGYAVTRLTHSLQTATRAERDGRDEEYVVCALLHDIGDTFACANHSELAATILQPFVSEENHWIVGHPGYDPLPLAHFEQMVRKVFAAPRRSLYVNLETGRMSGL